MLIGAVLLSMALAACGNEKTKTYTVGVINIVPDLDQTLVGFKEGMTELGYIEGENIHYIYNGPTTDLGQLAAEAQVLLEAEVDLIITMTTPATLAAKEATAGDEPPIVFAVVTDPLGAGIVDSLLHPGANVTGVAFGLQEERRLEWMVQIAPEIRQIYVPFNPGDSSPVLALEKVRGAAEKLDVELITQEVVDQETLDAAVSNIPAEADAVFLLPDGLVATRWTDLVTLANNRNLPTSAANVSSVESVDALSSFGFDQRLAGKQTARLADRIFKGDKPADLPVEVVEFYLAINLQTAKAIGLDIPEEILRQADIIIR
jgi:putative ABC transport system substrate-binding protein